MKTLDNYTTKELLLQVIKNIFRFIWMSRIMYPFRKRWNHSKNFREWVIFFSVIAVFVIISIYIFIPIMTYITNFVNYVYWGIGA